MAFAYFSLIAPRDEAGPRFDEASHRLQQLQETRLVAASEPARVPDTRADQRCKVVGVRSGLKARVLLDACIAIEAAMGCDHTAVWAPRPIDIDLLVYDDIEIRSARLHLPHPFAHSRSYVIEPLRQIAPDVAAWVERVGMRPR